jgi:hypothetical protein
LGDGQQDQCAKQIRRVVACNREATSDELNSGAYATVRIFELLGAFENQRVQSPANRLPSFQQFLHDLRAFCGGDVGLRLGGP